MLNIAQLTTQLTVGIQSLTVDEFLAIGIILYIVHKIVGLAHSNAAQWFWILFSSFIFYNVLEGIYPIFSNEFFAAIAIFTTASPVLFRTYRSIVKVKNRVTYIAPEIPTYHPRFGLTKEEMEIKRINDKREQETLDKKQQYLQNILKKMDDF